jgi:DNA-binding NarL/FixJ family response regulator
MLIEMAPHRVDAVLIDVQVGGTDGAPLAREVRERWPRLAVVQMSAHPAEVMAAQDRAVLRLSLLGQASRSR